MILKIYKDVEARLPRKILEEAFQTVFSTRGYSRMKGTVNLVILSDRKMRALNNQYRQKDKSTDVLSFNIDQPEDDCDVFGEIYISDNIARKQAREYNTTLTKEYARLFVHGLLHLLGYDHIEENDARVMRRMENSFMKKIFGA